MLHVSLDYLYAENVINLDVALYSASETTFINYSIWKTTNFTEYFIPIVLPMTSFSIEVHTKQTYLLLEGFSKK